MAITRIGNPAIADQRGINFRNVIINGDMSIAQRGTSTTGLQNSPEFLIDRWSYRRNGTFTSATFSMAQSTDVPTGQGFTKSAKIDCTATESSLPADVFAAFNQAIEGQMLQYLKKGTSNAESLALSFWVKSNKTGTYIFNLWDQDNNRLIAKSYTISSANTWEKKTIILDADTTGTLDNDNASSFQLYWYFCAGSNFTSGTLQTSWGTRVDADRAVGQVNLADSTSNEWYITGVQLEAGQVASDFEFLPHDINEQRCHRYYYRLTASTAYANGGTGRAYSTANGQAFVDMPVPMRASPSSTGYSALSDWNHSGSGSITALSPASHVTGDYRRMTIDITGGFTNGQAVALNANNTTSAWIEWDAEL